MKILVVNTLYYPNFQGGAEKSVQLLCEGFVDQGHEVAVVSNGPFNRTEEVNGVTVLYQRTRNVRSFLKVRGTFAPVRLLWHLIDVLNPFYFFFFRRLFKDFQPDIFFTNNLPGFSVFVWVLARWRHIPIVHVLRDHALMCPRGTMYHNDQRCDKQCFSCRIFSFPKKKMSSLVSGVVGISKYILERHQQSGYFSSVDYALAIPNSVAKLLSDVEHRKALHHVLVFGYLGRLSNEKGVGYLVDEFLKLKEENACQLMIGGTGEQEYVASLKEKCKGRNIVFLGVVDPADFYKQLDYLIVPSLLEETFGRVVIEAWQNGLFVLGAVSGGMPELQRYGNIELFYPNKGELLSLIQKCQRGECAFNPTHYQAYKHLFEKDRVAGAYLQLFKALIK